MAPPFARSADFALDKPAGAPCPKLGADHRCSVHAALRAQGFAGCAVFDCFGAGQRLTQQTLPGGDWRRGGREAEQIFSSFHILYSLHALLWHLDCARQRPVGAALAASLEQRFAQIDALAAGPPEALASAPLATLKAEVNTLLLAVSARLRVGPAARARRPASRIGARLQGADLRGADLFGVALIGADLRGADLRGADLRGADLRGADLRGADLREALFLRQAQLEAARGDAATRLSPPLARPAHW